MSTAARSSSANETGPRVRRAMSIYEASVTTIQGDRTSLAEHRGKTLLIVNVASKCGHTPQYEGLQDLHDRFASRGFAVLGFPCNQFNGQEAGTDAEIQAFCDLNYSVSFPLYSK